MNQQQFFELSEQVNNSAVLLARSVKEEDSRKDDLMKSLGQVFDLNCKSIKAYNVSIGNKLYNVPGFEDAVKLNIKKSVNLSAQDIERELSLIESNAKTLLESKVSSTVTEKGKPMRMISWEKKTVDENRYSKIQKSVDSAREVFATEAEIKEPSDSE